jgi:hypothetical protein
MYSGDSPGFPNIMQLHAEEGPGVIVMGNEWAYGVAFRGTVIRDTVADLQVISTGGEILDQLLIIVGLGSSALAVCSAWKWWRVLPASWPVISI